MGTSLTNSLRSLACNDAVPFDCECTASTIAALAADTVTATPLVCAVLGATLPFGQLAFALTTGFYLSPDLDSLLLRNTVACPPPVDDSGALIGADVVFDLLSLRTPAAGKEKGPIH